MQTSEEMKSYLKNIRFYTEQVNKLARKQFKADEESANKIGIAEEPGGIRFDCLLCIILACEKVQLYTQNIESNINQAEAQDKKLHQN